MQGKAQGGSMKSLWDDLSPLLKTMAAFSFFINLLFIAPAMFSLQLFDRVIPSNSKETLLMLILGTGLALLMLLVLDYVRSRLQQVLGTVVDEKLSPPVMKVLVNMAARAPHQARSDGIRDVAAVRNVFTANGITSLLDAPWTPVYVIVIWFFHPVLGLAAAASALLMLVLAWLNDRLSRAPLEELQQEGRRTSYYVESSLRNAEILQALGMTDKLLARWRYMHDRMSGMQIKASRIGAAFSAGTRFVRQWIQIVMLALGAYLVLAQEASAGIMIATSILLGRALQPVEQLVAGWRTLTEGRAAYSRLQTLSQNFEKEASQLTIPKPEGRLLADGVSFRTAGSDKPILINVAFALEPGEALAIIGPSAAGKSTLARLVTGVWSPTTGTIRLDGADVAYWPRQDIGQWIGYVPQDVELFEGTVADNIARLGQVDSEAVVAAAKNANAHELILGLEHGYDTQVGAQGLRLSPGQRQRIALARALYGNPSLVVLDEPNSNLDGAGELALAAAISNLRKQRITSVIVTHRPSLIAHVDKMLVLDAGRVQKFGPAQEVMKAMHKQSMAVVDGKAA